MASARKKELKYTYKTSWYGRSASGLDADLINFTAHTGTVYLVQD